MARGNTGFCATFTGEFMYHFNLIISHDDQNSAWFMDEGKNKLNRADEIMFTVLKLAIEVL